MYIYVTSLGRNWKSLIRRRFVRIDCKKLNKKESVLLKHSHAHSGDSYLRWNMVYIFI